MKRNDYICLFLSILINIGIILFLTVFSKPEEIIKTDEVKIGLVDYETNASTKFKGEKNADAKKKNLDATSIEKASEENKEEVKEEEIKQEEVREEPKPKEEKKAELKEVKKVEKEKEKVVEKKLEKAEKAEKVIPDKKVKEKEKPKENVKENVKENTKETAKETKKKPSLADLKKQINSSQPKTSTNGGYSSSDDTEEVVDRVLQNVSYSDGLVSGSRVGNSAGGLITTWNSKNRVPEFPQSAKLSGKHGKLTIRLKVDKNGNVLSYVIEKGSGVPEIDAALERVIGTWRVAAKKGDKPVSGVFLIDYEFKFSK